MPDAATSRWCATPSTAWPWAPIASLVTLQRTGALTVTTSPNFAEQVAGAPPRTLRRRAPGHQDALLGAHWLNGLAFKSGTLYIAELSKISKVEKVEDNLDNPPKPVLIYDDLPEGRAPWLEVPDHRARQQVVFPGRRALQHLHAVACPCADPAHQHPTAAARKSSRAAYDRSSAWTGTRPRKQLYFTENSRDWLSEDIPEDKLNRLAQPGKDNFGYPCASTDTTAIHFRSSVGASMSERPPRTTGSACTPAAKPLRHADESKSACEKPGYQCRHMRRFCRTEFK